ncbi:MAG: hypothetical protein ACRDRG_15945 [Pseudonocardiaceae bacterium]
MHEEQSLFYPKWIPGTHGPTGVIINLSGLKFTASGKTLPWRRDPVDMYAFHIDVPQGTAAVEASFEFLAPTSAGRLSSDSSTTPHLFVFCNAEARRGGEGALWRRALRR